MRVTVFRADPPTLLAALSDAPLVQRWLAQQEEDLKSLVERALLTHIRQLTTIASRILAEGVERVAEQDTAAVDAFLSDAFAVATWHGWELPLESLGELDVPVEELPRGLLGADRSREGAQVWLLDDQTVAIARNRTVSADAVGG
jgi:hypothetical protein